MTTAPASRALCRAAPIVAAATLCGCTLVDDRQVQLIGLSTMPATDVLRYRVRTNRGVETARLAVDGRPLGTVPTNTDNALDVSALAEGTHVLSATGDFERPMDPATWGFWIERGYPYGEAMRLVEMSPPAGQLVAPSPFTADFLFSRLLSRTALDATFTKWWGTPLPTAVEFTGPRSIRMKLLVPVETLGTVQAQVVAQTMTGQRAVVQAAWSLFPASVTVEQPVGEVYSNGDVPVRLTVTAPTAPVAPDRALLLADGAPVATLALPTGPATVWDTRSSPEGRYRLSLIIPGYADDGSWSRMDTVVVDRTPPHVTCAREGGATGELSVQETLVLSANEPVSAWPVLLADGVRLPLTGWSSNIPWSETRLVPPRSEPRRPYTLEVALEPGASDRAGNPVVFAGCSFAVPTWLSPWGTGDLATWDGAIRAREIGFGGKLDLAFIPPPGDPGAGALLVAQASPSSLLSAPAALAPSSARASGVSMSGAHLAWTEQPGGGPGRVRSATRTASGWSVAAAALNGNLTLDAAQAVFGAYLPGYLAEPTVAWTEDDGAGGRTLRSLALRGGTWLDVGGDVRSAPGAIVEHPSVSSNEPGAGPFSSQFVAFLETVPGGVPQARAATARVVFGVPWSAVPGSLNLDPAVPASEPSAFAFGGAVVAWVEAGAVVARILDFSTGAPGPASILNVDPAHAARSPRVTTDRVVVFTETGPSGDEIWARRWDGAGWVLLPGPLNAGFPPGVRFLAVASGTWATIPGPGVAWVDGAYRVHVRYGNW